MEKTFKLKQSKTNKNFSSNESKMKISSDENQKVNSKSQNKNKAKKSKKDKKVQETQTQTGEEQKDNLTILKEKNSKLESDLNHVKLDIDMERNNFIKESNNLNLKISEINNEINRLRLDNKYLTNNLYSMQKKLETKINQSMHTKMRNKSGEIENNNNEKLNKSIKLKEKMILNSKQNLKLLKKEKEVLEKEIKKIEGVKKESLKKHLEDIKNTQNEKIKEMEELKNIQSEHSKICIKKISELLKQYDLIKKEYEFEIKKCKVINEKSINKNLKNGMISRSSKNVKIISSSENNNTNNINKTFSKNKITKNKKLTIYDAQAKKNNYNIFDFYSRRYIENNKKDNISKINEGFLQENNINSDRKDSPSNIVSSSINYTSSNEPNKNNIMMNMKLNNISNQNKNYYKNKTLFTESEKQLLSKLIPNKLLDNYEQKYELLQKENNNIKIKMKDSTSKKRLSKSNNILKLQNSNLQNNILNKKKIFLNLKVNEYQRKKFELNEKIKENQKQIEYYQIIYKKKNKEFNILLSEYKRIYNDIKNGKLYLKKGAQLNEKNIQIMQKYGMDESDNESFNGNDDVDNINYSEDEDNEKREEDEDGEENNEN